MISVIIPVYRNATGALRLVKTLKKQMFTQISAFEIIVVDDGSGDDSVDRLRAQEDQQFRLVYLPYNQGRSMACNKGAECAKGKYLIFIDCDCVPVENNFFNAHFDMLASGSIASCGSVIGHDDGFWSRYQRDASKRRLRQYSAGIVFSGTTANLMVCADAFREVGGFDARYTTYGFEDRDLLIRLAKIGKLSWCSNATVRHLDVLTLPAVLEKIRQAAGKSALIFWQDHPDAYEALGYATLDTRIHTWLHPVAKLVAPMQRLAPFAEYFLKYSWFPYFVSKSVVKLLVAFAFMCGTCNDDGSMKQFEA